MVHFEVCGVRLEFVIAPLVSEGGGLVCESVGKADLLSDHFDSMQFREAVDLLLTCHPSLSFTTFAFRSSEVRPLSLDLDPYGGTDPLSMFPLFLKRTTDVMAPRLRVVFRWLVRLGSFLNFVSVGQLYGRVLIKRGWWNKGETCIFGVYGFGEGIS